MGDFVLFPFRLRHVMRDVHLGWRSALIPLLRTRIHNRRTLCPHRSLTFHRLVVLVFWSYGS